MTICDTFYETNLCFQSLNAEFLQLLPPHLVGVITPPGWYFLKTCTAKEGLLVGHIPVTRLIVSVTLASTSPQSGFLSDKWEGGDLELLNSW